MTRYTLQYIDKNPRADLRLSALCKYVSISPAHFSRTFKQFVGLNVTDFVVAKRIALAKERMLLTDDSIQQIAFGCGFESLPYFYKNSRA
jgi:AraC-like DNA-binding protein